MSHVKSQEPTDTHELRQVYLRIYITTKNDSQTQTYTNSGEVISVLAQQEVPLLQALGHELDFVADSMLLPADALVTGEVSE